MALARAKAAQVQQQQHRDLVPILAVWFGSKAAIGATRLPSEIVAELVRAGFDPDAVVRAGEIVLNHPLSGRTRSGSPEPKPGSAATRMVAAEEPDMRARYLLAAAERLTEAQQAGDVDAAVKREETYAAQHAAAGRNRRAAAKRLADLAGSDDRLLVWRAVLDQRTTPDCFALNGQLFHASNPPAIPGAVHPACRCTAETWGHPGPLLNWGTPEGG